MEKQQKNVTTKILDCVNNVIGYYEDKDNRPVIERLGEQVLDYRKSFVKDLEEIDTTFSKKLMSFFKTEDKAKIAMFISVLSSGSLREFNNNKVVVNTERLGSIFNTIKMVDVSNRNKKLIVDPASTDELSQEFEDVFCFISSEKEYNSFFKEVEEFLAKYSNKKLSYYFNSGEKLLSLAPITGETIMLVDDGMFVYKTVKTDLQESFLLTLPSKIFFSIIFADGKTNTDVVDSVILSEFLDKIYIITELFIEMEKANQEFVLNPSQNATEIIRALISLLAFKMTLDVQGIIPRDVLFDFSNELEMDCLKIVKEELSPEFEKAVGLFQQRVKDLIF